MNIEMPAELLLPTVEELEEKTARDRATKWKLRKRPGKKERNAIKQKKEVAKRPIQPKANSLSSLFVKKESTKFSLNDVNTGTVAKTARPTLRVSLGEHTSKPIATDVQLVRKRGRPPKMKPI